MMTDLRSPGLVRLSALKNNPNAKGRASHQGRGSEMNQVFRVSPERQIQFDYLRKTTFLNLPFPLNIDHFKTYLRNLLVRGGGLVEPGNPVREAPVLPKDQKHPLQQKQELPYCGMEVDRGNLHRFDHQRLRIRRLRRSNNQVEYKCQGCKDGGSPQKDKRHRHQAYSNAQPGADDDIKGLPVCRRPP